MTQLNFLKRLVLSSLEHSLCHLCIGILISNYIFPDLGMNSYSVDFEPSLGSLSYTADERFNHLIVFSKMQRTCKLVCHQYKFSSLFNYAHIHASIKQILLLLQRKIKQCRRQKMVQNAPF